METLETCTTLSSPDAPVPAAEEDDKLKGTQQWNVDRVNAHIQAHRGNLPWLSLANHFEAADSSEAASCLRAVCALLDAKRSSKLSAVTPPVNEPEKKKRRLTIGKRTSTDRAEDAPPPPAVPDENEPPSSETNLSGPSSRLTLIPLPVASRKRKFQTYKVHVTSIDAVATVLSGVAGTGSSSTTVWYLSRLVCFGSELLGLASPRDKLLVHFVEHFKKANVSYTALGILARLCVHTFRPALPPSEQLPSPSEVLAEARRLALLVGAQAAQSLPIDVECVEGRAEAEWLLNVRHVFKSSMQDPRACEALIVCAGEVYLNFSEAHRTRMQRLVDLRHIDLSKATPNKRKILEKAASIEKACQDLCGLEQIPGVDEVMDHMLGLIKGRIHLLDAHVSLLSKYHLLSDYLLFHCLPLPHQGDMDERKEKLVLYVKEEVLKLKEVKDLEKEAASKEAREEAERIQSSQTQARKRLEKALPTIHYLLEMERIATSKRFNSVEPLSPHIILGVPLNVTEAMLKKIKLKVQMAVHPDKLGLEALDDAERSTMQAKANQAFKLVTEALTTLHNERRSGQFGVAWAPMRVPPYAAECGIPSFSVPSHGRCASQPPVQPPPRRTSPLMKPCEVLAFKTWRWTTIYSNDSPASQLTGASCPTLKIEAEQMVRGSDLPLRISGKELGSSHVTAVHIFVQFPLLEQISPAHTKIALIVKFLNPANRATTWSVCMPELPICGFGTEQVYRIGIQILEEPAQYSQIVWTKHAIRIMPPSGFSARRLRNLLRYFIHAIPDVYPRIKQELFTLDEPTLSKMRAKEAEQQLETFFNQLK